MTDLTWEDIEHACAVGAERSIDGSPEQLAFLLCEENAREQQGKQPRHIRRSKHGPFYHVDYTNQHPLP